MYLQRLASSLLMLLLWVGSVVAQAPENLQHTADMMVRLCVAGGRTEATSAIGSGGADLSLRSLDVTGNLKGELKISKSNAEGLVNGLDNAMSQVAADQADKVRSCLQPLRERLLDILLPPRGESTDTFTTGTLVPGHDPNPKTVCHIPPDSLTVYLGNNGGATYALSFPHTVVRMCGKDIFIIDRDLNNEIAVSLYVYGDDGRPIVTLKNNRFDLNPHNEWTKEQTSDRTSLRVYDNQHIKVLDIKYFNETAVRITGIFKYGRHSIRVTEDHIVDEDAGTISDVCASLTVDNPKPLGASADKAGGTIWDKASRTYWERCR